MIANFFKKNGELRIALTGVMLIQLRNIWSPVKESYKKYLRNTCYVMVMISLYRYFMRIASDFNNFLMIFSFCLGIKKLRDNLCCLSDR